MDDIYYNRVLSKESEEVFIKKYFWINDIVKDFPQLDFQITFNPSKDKHKNTIKSKGCSRFLIYRGTSRPLSFLFSSSGKLKIEAAKSYEKFVPENMEYHVSSKKILFAPEGLTKENIRKYLINVENEPYFRSYYKSDDGFEREGVFQNMLSRRYTLFSQSDDDFIIFDKEFEFGFMSKEIENIFNNDGPIPTIIELKNAAEKKGLKINSSHIKKNSFDEIDCVGINNKGDIMIFEVKRPDNTDGIVYGPMQVRYYIEQIDKALHDETFKPVFYSAICNIVKQKQRMGIIPTAWKMPSELSGNIIPYLIFGREGNYPNLKGKKKDEFELIYKVFNDRDYPLRIAICSDELNNYGSLIDWNL